MRPDFPDSAGPMPSDPLTSVRFRYTDASIVVDTAGWPASADARRSCRELAEALADATSGEVSVYGATVGVRDAGSSQQGDHAARESSHRCFDVAVQLGPAASRHTKAKIRLRVLLGGEALSERYMWDPAGGEPYQVFLVAEGDGVPEGTLAYGPVETRAAPQSRVANWAQLLRALGLHCALFVRQLKGAHASPAISASPRWDAHAPRPGSAWRYWVNRVKSAWRHQVLRRPIWRQWSIGIGTAPELDRCGALRTELSMLSWIVPPTDRFWADPFLVVHEGRWLLLYEEQLRTGGPGTLWFREIDAIRGVPTGDPERVTLEGHDGGHLSFPFCFMHEGVWFMVPEQAARGSVALYRAIDFPRRWALERELLPGVPGIDSVLQWIGDRWWLFTSDGRAGNHDNHLLLFSSPSLEGEFVLHPSAPIRCGLRGARNAGPLQRIEGQLYRFGQDCRPKYGAAVVEYRIARIDDAMYQEEEQFSIQPNFDRRFSGGIHTIGGSMSARLIVVDGVRHVR